MFVGCYKASVPFDFGDVRLILLYNWACYAFCVGEKALTVSPVTASVSSLFKDEAFVEESALVGEFAIIMAVASIAIVVFQWLRQPPVLGYLLAGVIVGPFTLPLFGLAAPITDTHTIRLVADLGLVLLLFALGMEFGWNRIRQMGLRVILIGTVEIIFMIALGFELATLLGWSGMEAIFLGAAISISSSAIIVKVLRDSGMLMQSHGRLIVGVLVVEDFAAVLLLSVLSGLATSGTANLSDIMDLGAKLGLFLMCALFGGALLAPRIINFVARFNSREALLIVGLAMCFGLALVGVSLGTSAAAGAFIIGTVLGDTEHAETLASTMTPVRDVFAALFFVSIGMLIDPSVLGQYIIPSLIIAAVFMVGKTVAVTLGTFFVGHDGRASLGVGTGTTLMGEFSLAMVKTGVDHSVVGAFMYPVVAAATAITSLFYPLLMRSSAPVSNMLERRSPRLLRRYISSLSRSLISMRAVFGLQNEFARRVRRSVRVIIVNFGLMVVIIGVGTVALRFANLLVTTFDLRPGMLGLVVSALVVVMCMPPSVLIWGALNRMTDEISTFILRVEHHRTYLLGKVDLHDVLQYSILILMIAMLGIWSMPFISNLVVLGSFSTPIAVVFLLGLIGLMWRVSFKIHGIMAATFSRTFLGDQEDE